jgi:hypothetical protein
LAYCCVPQYIDQIAAGTAIHVNVATNKPVYMVVWSRQSAPHQ